MHNYPKPINNTPFASINSDFNDFGSKKFMFERKIIRRFKRHFLFSSFRKSKPYRLITVVFEVKMSHEGGRGSV